MSINQRAKDMWVEDLVRENRKLKSDIEDMDKALLQHIKAVTELQDKIKKLEEENKKLKKECEENDYLVEDNARWMKRHEEKIMEIKNLRKEIMEIEKNQEYRYHRCMVAERWWEDNS